MLCTTTFSLIEAPHGRAQARRFRAVDVKALDVGRTEARLLGVRVLHRPVGRQRLSIPSRAELPDLLTRPAFAADVGTDSYVEVMTLLDRYRSQPITQNDIDSGHIRFPAATRPLFPTVRTELTVELQGVPQQVRWDPRLDADVNRSGVMIFGKERVRNLVTVGDALDLMVAGVVYRLSSPSVPGTTTTRHAGEADDHGFGTWRVGPPPTKVAWSDAIAEWTAAAVPILQRVASNYNGSITYEDLAERIQTETGIRTRVRLSNWIGKVLGPVQDETLTSGNPPLSSLVIQKHTGGVGAGYINHTHMEGYSDDTERQRAAAEDRLTCYRAYCQDLPEDAEPQMTELYVCRHQPRKRDSRPRAEVATCPRCHMALPASGVCECDG